MKRMLLLLAAVLIACGSASKPPPAPISNTTSSTTATTPSTAEPARVVMRYAKGGVIELSGDRDRAMAAAEKAMTAHCGENAYTITQEGEEAVGTDTSGPSTVTVTAWRVHYQCRQMIDI